MADIIQQFFISEKSQKVFEALSSPAGLNSWWPLESSGKPELNSNYRFYFGPEYDWEAKVIHVIPGKELIWQMTKAMTDWMPTKVGFKLTETDKGTSVYFFHSNWPEANEHFAISNFCWGQLLKGLKVFVETGEIIPFDKRN